MTYYVKHEMKQNSRTTTLGSLRMDTLMETLVEEANQSAELSSDREKIRFLDNFMFRHHEDLTDKEKNGLYQIYLEYLQKAYPEN